MAVDETLVAELMQRLELDHQYYEDVPAYDQDRIDLVRACGRAAARRLGWKVRTFAQDLSNGYTRLFVLITESTPEDQARMRDRGDELIRHAMKNWPSA